MIEIRQAKATAVPSDFSFYITFKYNEQIVSAIKEIDGRSYNAKTKVWEIHPDFLHTLLDKLCLIDDIKLILENEPAEKEYNLSLNYKVKPFKHQLEAIKYGLNNDDWLLLDVPGLGKTLSATYLAEELKTQKQISHCLVICGVNSLKTNWKREIEKTSNEKCLILGEKVSKKGNITYGSIKDRVEQLMQPIKEFFVILNIETLRDDRVIDALNSGVNKFDMIVVDEVHKIKSPKAQQSINLLKLDAKYKLGLTGTLLVNSPLDSYVVLKWLGKINCSFTNDERFFGVFGKKFNRQNVLIGFKNLAVFKNMLKDCSLRRTKDLLDLPPKTIIKERLDLSPEQSNFYNDVKNGVKNDIKVNLNVTDIRSLITRLREATVLPKMLTDKEISSVKIDRCVDLVNQIIDSGEKVVVFSTYKEPINTLNTLLKQYNPVVVTGDTKAGEVQPRVNMFQEDDEHKVFLATWNKMGTGFTLTRASYLIFLDTPWTYAEFEQACDRLHRTGAKKSVTIYVLICNDTIDEKVDELVESKKEMSEFLIDNKSSGNLFNVFGKYLLNL